MPKKHGRSPQSYTRKIAFSGVIAALAVVVMLMGNIIPIATFVAPALAGLLMLPVALEADKRTAFMCYGVVCLLSLLWVSDTEMALFFVFLLGYYPIIYSSLTKIPNRIVQYAAKLLIFNAAVLAVYFLLIVIIASPAIIAELNESGLLFAALLLLVGNITFVMYDVLLGRLTFVYICKFKGRFF